MRPVGLVRVGHPAAILVALSLVAGCGQGSSGLAATSTMPQAQASPVATSTAGAPGAVTRTVPGTPGPAATPATVTLIAAGDIGRCDGTDDDATGRLVASIPGVVATLGDTAYENGTAAELADCFGGGWGSVKDRIAYAVMGNHDLRTDGGAPLRAYLGAAVSRGGHTWFSDQLGAWHVIVLDANCGDVAGGCGEDSPQVGWLRDDLAANRDRCTLALWHQPRFSSGAHEDTVNAGGFWDALYHGGADLVLNGHDHDYERFGAQDPGGSPDPAHGLTEIVVGTGGAELRGFGPVVPNSVTRIEGVYGVLKLDLAPTGWTSAFVEVGGSATDEAHGTCH